MMPILHSPGVITPGQFGPIELRPRASPACLEHVLDLDHVAHRDALGDADDQRRCRRRPPRGSRRRRTAAARRSRVAFARRSSARPRRRCRTRDLCPRRTSRRRLPGVTPRRRPACRTRRICFAWNARLAGDALTTRRVFLSTRTLIFAAPRAGAFDDLLRAVGHVVVAAWMASPLSVEHLLAELDVRALEPHDERHLQADLLGRGDDARRR